METKDNGRVILRSVPTKIAEKQVAGYLRKIAKSYTEEQITEKIRQTPTVLFEKVSVAKGNKIAGDLIKLGAVAGFEAFSAASGQSSGTKTHGPATGTSIPAAHSDNLNVASEEPLHALGSRFSRWPIIALPLVLLVCMLLLLFLPNHDPDETATTLHNKNPSHQPALAQHVNKANNLRPKENIAAGTSPAVDKPETATVKDATRVGVYIFSARIPGLSDLNYAKGLSSSVADALKADPRIDCVERAMIDQIVKKESLTVKQLLDPKEAARVGRQVGIDTIVVGQLICKDKKNNQYSEKSIAVKAISTDSGLTIDIGCIQSGKQSSYNKHLQALVRFVRSVSTSGEPLNQTSFLALGDFIDHSPPKKKANPKSQAKPFQGRRLPPGIPESHQRSRLPSQSQNLHRYLIKAFEDRRNFFIVSQSHLKHFFAKLDLNEHGHCRENESGPPVNPAYTLVSGAFKVNPADETPFEMELQFEFLGKTKQSVTIEGKSWNDGLKKLSTEIDFLIRAKGDLAKLEWVRNEKYRLCKEKGPVCEAKAHFKRGRELSGIRYGSWPYLNVSAWGDGQGFSFDSLDTRKKNTDGQWQELSKERINKNIRDATDAFESAVFLDPENFDAKLFLAVCLSHPAIGEKGRAKDLLQQIISKSADDRLRFVAAKALGSAESISYAPSFEQKLYTPKYYADTYAGNVQSLTYEEGEYAAWWKYEASERAFVFDAIKKSILAQCENVKWKKEKGGDVKYELNAASAQLTRLTWNINKSIEMEQYCREVLSIIREKYPQQFPFLIANCGGKSSLFILMELRRALHHVEAGNIAPLLEQKFLYELHGTLRTLAHSDTRGYSLSEAREYFTAGVKIGEFLERRDPLVRFYKVCHAYCYKGMGELDKAFSLLEQVEGGNTAQIREALAENTYKAFWKILTKGSAKDAQKQVAQQARRSISSEVAVPKDRFIRALAQDGDTLWICSNITQDLISPTGVYDPMIYSFRKGMTEPLPLELPVKIKGMATSIVAKNNTVWIGTDEGLLKVNPKQNVFQHYKENDGLLKPNVNALSLQDNKLYVSMGSGIGYLDIAKNRFTGLVNTNDVVRLVGSPEGLYAVTKEGRLHLYDEKTGKKLFTSAWKCPNAYCLTVNPRYVVIGKNLQTTRFFGMRNVGSKAFALYDRKNDQIGMLEPHFPGTDMLSLAFVNDLLWIGGRGFLAVVDLSERKVLDQLSGRGSLFHAMLADNQGGIWVSQGHKLYHLGYGSDGFEKR